MRVYDEVLVPNLFAPWAEVLLDAVGVAPGDHVLDVASGPGTVARPAAARVGRAGQVVACDISPAMLELGRLKPVPEDAAQISWVNPQRRRWRAHWPALTAASTS